jgi:RNA polymerase sigma factor for flagellar operon FliA
MSTTRPRPRASRRLSSDELHRLWEAYRDSGDPALRDQLVFFLTPLVRHLATRKVRQLPTFCELDDLTSAGFEALLVSIDRLDPAKGATLEQYAWTRVNGSIIDEVRRNDRAPRSLRRWQREAEAARLQLRGRLDREPTDEELAVRMRTSAADVRDQSDKLFLAEVESLALTITVSDNVTVDRAETLPSTDSTLDPAHACEVNEARARVAAAVASLPERDRTIARLLYVEGRRLREVGEILGVTESRVCQLAARLRTRLRSSLGEHADMLTATLA